MLNFCDVGAIRGLLELRGLLSLTKPSCPSRLKQPLVLRTSLWPRVAILLHRESSWIGSRQRVFQREVREFSASVPNNPTRPSCYLQSSICQCSHPPLWLGNPSLSPTFSLQKFRVSQSNKCGSLHHFGALFAALVASF